MREIDTIYNRYGEPTLRLLANGRFVTFPGQSVGFLDGVNLYNYSGSHVGWYENGIMRDHNGSCVGFGLSPTDSPRPFLPFKQLRPLPGLVELEPLRPLRALPPLRPIKSFNWSDMDPIELFLE